MKRIKICIVVMLCCLIMASCNLNTENEVYRTGSFAYAVLKEQMLMGAESDTNVFAKDDVNIKLYYGFYDVKDDEQQQKSIYRLEENDSFFVSMYICEEKYKFDITNSGKYEDYTKIDNHDFVKKISGIDMFSEEYGYSMDFPTGVTYGHEEMINIPSKFFSNESGGIVIQLVSFIEPQSANDMYRAEYMGYLRLYYEITENGDVKIVTLEKK